ncbi:hypothetical protein TanjilG_22300 [Lupinus angustifolius]|uniref:Uncharacterized protein n=1 Tax=Lupinus angustifolius TaxID=3871 RepID=A0A1J7HT45_LUPAN|nr:PREDICTED: uncharacterized protein LOC109358746 [Lupinus angustifolius]OIW03643.1 hypothetical protein TanjilG_22300 [Lupinus angustifolius]
MNHCGYQQKNAMTGCEEMRMESVVCPKPRRLGLLSIDNHIRTFRPPFNNYQSDIEDSGVGAELLDIIRPKGSCYNPERSGGQVASSPPFFCGSPPSRASNPVIQDEQFGNGNVSVNFSPFSMAPPSPTSSARSCVRMKFGHSPAAVRIEGFDCLSMDRNNRSIYARA